MGDKDTLLQDVKKAQKFLTENISNLSWDADCAGYILSNGGRFAGSAVRTCVYKNNQAIFAAGKYITPSGKEVSLGDRQSLLDATKVYSSEFRVDDVPACPGKLETGCVNLDCIEVARMMTEDGYNPAILNLADAYHACGMYNSGSNAQEESLCRASTLSLTLYQYFTKSWAAKAGVPLREKSAYPMDMRFGGIYSPGLLVFRHGSDLAYKLREEPFRTSVISVAALNFKEGHKTNNIEGNMSPDGGFTPQGEPIMIDKIRTIYRIALSNGHDSVVLGAFGCGVFKLKPELVSALFKKVLEEPEFKGKFRSVVFAMLAPAGDNKYSAFYNDFGRWA